MSFNVIYNGYSIIETILWDKAEQALQGYTRGFRIIYHGVLKIQVKYATVATIEEAMKYIDSIVEAYLHDI